MFCRGLKRWSARWLKLGCLCAGLALPALAWAQGPAPNASAPASKAAKLPQKTFTKNTTFHLPVQMEERTRANLKEICLYVKQGNADWVRQETAKPSITHFTYRVPRDGEYWFSLVSVAKDGKAIPADVSKESPQLRVVVDTAPPVLEVEPGATSTGEFCLRCKALDLTLDQGSLKVVSRTENGDRPLEPVPGMAGAFKVANPTLLSAPVRVSAADKCGNVAVKEINLKNMIPASQAGGPAAHSSTQTTSNKMETVSIPPAFPQLDALPLPESPKTEPNGRNLGVAAPTLPSIPPVLPGQSPSAGTPARIDSESLPAVPFAQPGASPTNLQTNYVPTPPQTFTPPAAPGPNTSANAPGQRLLLRTTKAAIDYRIDQVGPSGVGRIEVFLTSDQGQSWQKAGSDPDRRSPAEIELPGEGLFGLKLVVTNGNGFGGRPPVRGEQPTCWVEVDATSPFVQLRPSESLANDGHLDIRWTASDKNLSPEPVSLFFRTRPDGPWQPIARHLKNDGLYRWAFPRDLGSQFFIKVEVADQAGNLGTAETQQPILLDMTEPRVQVLGVTGMNGR